MEYTFAKRFMWLRTHVHQSSVLLVYSFYNIFGDANSILTTSRDGRESILSPFVITVSLATSGEKMVSDDNSDVTSRTGILLFCLY